MVVDRVDQARGQVELIYRAESRRVLATLIRLLGGFDLAEEALHEAFAAALGQWPREGVPSNPRAWLVSVGRFRGIDALRRRRRFEDAVLGPHASSHWPPPPAADPDAVADDHLRLLFTCCRPELPLDSQIAMTLREVCGLTTEEIARAYLTRASTIAQRIVRAKQKIKDERLPYEVPVLADLPARRTAVLRVIYLVFNEGYSASSGADRVRVGLCDEAIRLARLVAELSPTPEVEGLLALLLLQDARRAARTSAAGDVVLLIDQDRSLWDRSRIAEGVARVEHALQSGGSGAYTIQAAIAALHAQSPDGPSTDWPQIVGLYEALITLEPSPVARLARAIAVGERDGAAAGLAIVEGLLTEGELNDYLPAHSARGELCRRLGRRVEALEAFRRALSLARQEPERRFFMRRLDELEG
jgi:RNA polymerase sigma-70 factor (ECF subfamily)